MIRIGEELNQWQESVKEWYYSCLIAGTFLFMLFYLVVWTILLTLYQTIRQRASQMEEPPCDLNSLEDEYFWDPDNDFQNHHSMGSFRSSQEGSNGGVDESPNGRQEVGDFQDVASEPTRLPPAMSTVLNESDFRSQSSWEDIPSDNPPQIFSGTEDYDCS